MSGEKEFSVCQFFKDDSYEYVRRWVSAEQAVEASLHFVTSVAARLGMVKRVIITDGGDNTCFEWKHGKHEGTAYSTGTITFGAALKKSK